MSGLSLIDEYVRENRLHHMRGPATVVADVEACRVGADWLGSCRRDSRCLFEMIAAGSRASECPWVALAQRRVRRMLAGCVVCSKSWWCEGERRRHLSARTLIAKCGKYSRSHAQCASSHAVKKSRDTIMFRLAFMS